ncbi:hypothetical protein TNCV_1416921 [Trichonephila clavipes]|nr:hypothetical protein TNCV_1416921 [Trichonephila clavipes]
MSEGRFDLSTFRSERTNEASTLTITPKRSSSRDLGTSSYRYHTATYPPASVSANRRTNDTIFVASIESDPKHTATGQLVNPVEGMRGSEAGKRGWEGHTVILQPEKNSSFASPQQMSACQLLQFY